MEYVVEVTAKYTITLEADTDAEACQEACEISWMYDADSTDATVKSRIKQGMGLSPLYGSK